MKGALIPTICLIDDDKVLQFVFKEIISIYNVADEILIFSDGSEAWDFFSDTQRDAAQIPDLVILDLNMPKMDGWDFLDHYISITDQLAKKPVIYIMSSSTHPNDKQKANTYDVVSGYIVKPFDEDKILAVVKEAFP